VQKNGKNFSPAAFKNLKNRTADANKGHYNCLSILGAKMPTGYVQCSVADLHLG
jgi:hypothetical protein